MLSGRGSKAQQLNIVERPLRSKSDSVSLSAMTFLFSEFVQYCQQSVETGNDLEAKLEEAGVGIGVRLLELLVFKDKNGKRETRLLNIVSFIHTNVWRHLFGKPADSLEKGNDSDDEYMIIDKDLLLTRFISIPKDYGQLSCAAFAAGIVKGVLDAAGFPSKVTAHSMPVEGTSHIRTVILMKFEGAVIAREQRLG
mmetsp:Transcript_1951/g.7000  ORF Transcript_1951/g.7000 Transcript_1951/m.7000 type:complete len:196 (-) Transcript_1951:320-907(-)